MSIFKQTRRLALVGVVLLVTACGAVRGPEATAPKMAAESEFGTLAATGVQVAFNDAYLERIDLNEPKARANPKNTDKGLLRLIRGAKHSIDGAFYDIEDPGVTKALINAHKRGVKIRLVTDTDNMVSKTDPTKRREAIVALESAQVPIVDDQRSGIMHHKFMVVDSQTVWTGSTNLTTTSLYCHNNNAITLQVPALAKTFTTEFERLFVNREFGKSMRGATVPTREFDLGNGASVQAFFSPAGEGREAVVNELAASVTSVRFLTFSLTDIETGDTLLARAAAGVKVQGIFDRWLAGGQYSLFDRFRDAKLDVRKDGNEALMHHKAIIIDDATVISGSYNYSANAENNNNEAFLIFRGARGVAKAFGGEFDRIRYASIHNHPPAYKKPDPEKKTGEGP